MNLSIISSQIEGTQCTLDDVLGPDSTDTLSVCDHTSFFRWQWTRGQIGILKETTNAARNRVFSYEKYISILRKDT